MDMANAAIRGDNVAQISKLIDKYQTFNVSMNLMLNVFLNRQNNFVKNLNLLRLIEKQNKIEKLLELKIS